MAALAWLEGPFPWRRIEQEGSTLKLGRLPLTRRRFLAAAAFGPSALPALQALGADEPMPKPPPERGEWRQYRADRRLSGRSDIVGAIRQPAVRWTYPIAGRETLLLARLEKGSEKVSLPVTDVAVSPAGRSWSQLLMEWQIAGPYGASWLDLDGSGRLTGVTRSYNQKVGKVLTEVPGLQLIEVEPKGYPKVPNVYLGTVRLKVREKGQWVTRWETETPTLIWQAEPIFGDFDGDGKMEIAALPWFRLTLLDAATGAIKEQCNFLAEDESEIPGEGGRAYGWFGALDVDGDGETEFVIIEDFIRYATVIKRREGKLQRLWLKVWEPRREKVGALAGTLGPENTVVVRIGPEPVQDIDGDGRREILASVFNLEGDQRWHVVALDPLTGATKLDLPGQFLQGVRDADGDGLPELFCAAAPHGPRIPEPASLALYSFRGGTLRRTWELKDASFVTYTVEGFPPNVNTGAALGAETVLCKPLAGAPVFFTRKLLGEKLGEVEVTCWQAEAGRRIRPAAVWSGPRLVPINVRPGPDGGVLLRATTFEKEAAEVRTPGRRGTATVLVSQRVAAPVSPAVIGKPGPGARPLIVVQGANETVEAFRVPSTPRGSGADDGKPPQAKRVWRVPGRGMTCNNYYEGVTLADLSGEGDLSVVVGDRGPGDCARLKVVAAETGRNRWVHDFPDFPGTPPPWNVPGLMYWQGGYFRSGKRMDLLAQVRRVGGESTLLDGRSGKAVWQQTKGRPGRDFGRWWFAMYDFDRDGLEDVLNVYPDMFCVARGRDGALLVAEEIHKYVDLYAYYADVIVADFLGRGEPQVLYLHEFVTALLSGRGERIWKVEHAHPFGWRNQAGFGDADGSRRLALFFPDAAGPHGPEFQCRDAASGALQWSLPMPDAPATFPAVADIDGDGRDECLYTSGSDLYAVGARKQGEGGEILWKLTLPGRLGPVAFADVRGEGRGEIVVVCEDGHVYGIS